MLPKPSRLVTHVMLTLIACLAFACKNRPMSSVSVHQLAEEELGKDFTTELNSSKTHALCRQMRTGDHLNSIFKYCVISVSESKIVYKGIYQQGHVKWVNNDTIEVATADKFSTELKTQTISIKSSQP